MGEQVIARILPEPLDVDAAALPEALAPADEMNAAEKAAHPFALGARAELRPAPAAPLEHGEAETVVLEQRAALLNERRHDRNLRGRELEREAVLLGDRGGAPALRPVKLGDQRRAALDADLVDAILVTVQREDAAVRRHSPSDSTAAMMTSGVRRLYGCGLSLAALGSVNDGLMRSLWSGMADGTDTYSS